MLAAQFAIWAAYPPEVKAQIEVIVIDDSSPEPAVDVPRPDGLPALTIGRLSEVADPMTPPWRQDAARNRAAHEAKGDWLFLSDMDHVLPFDSAKTILLRSDGPDVAYTFKRLDMPFLRAKFDSRGKMHPHPNTYAMKKSRYWSVGGYDEDFVGIYGTDGPFKSRLRAACNIEHLDQTPIIRYPREVIPDASTRVDRKAFKDDGRIALKTGPPTVLSIPWTRQYP